MIQHLKPRTERRLLACINACDMIRHGHTVSYSDTFFFALCTTKKKKRKKCNIYPLPAPAPFPGLPRRMVGWVGGCTQQKQASTPPGPPLCSSAPRHVSPRLPAAAAAAGPAPLPPGPAREPALAPALAPVRGGVVMGHVRGPPPGEGRGGGGTSSVNVVECERSVRLG